MYVTSCSYMKNEPMIYKATSALTHLREAMKDLKRYEQIAKNNNVVEIALDKDYLNVIASLNETTTQLEEMIFKLFNSDELS